MFAAAEAGRNRQLASNNMSDIASLHGGPSPKPSISNFQKQQHNSSESLVDLNALDTKSRIGLKETDLSLINKQQKRRPGGSLASAASQHLKNRPVMAPGPAANGGPMPMGMPMGVSMGGGFPPNQYNPNKSSSRGNSMTSASSGSRSPLNPKFSPRSSATSNHGFFPPRRGGPPPGPGSPKSGNGSPRMPSIEIIAMEEKIKELQSQIMDKEDQLRKSLSMQSQHNPVMDEKIMKQYTLLEHENSVLSKELNEKNKELIAKLQELKEKEETIKEMEEYTNEQFDRLNQYEEQVGKMAEKANDYDELNSSADELKQKLQALQRQYDQQAELLKESDLKIEEANQNLVKQRHNIKFEYDAIIENKMKANELLQKQNEELKATLADKESDSTDYRQEAESANKQLDEVYSFLLEYAKESNIYVPVNILKDKLTIVNENPMLAKINTARQNQLSELFEAAMNDMMLYPGTNFNPSSPDFINHSDASPSVFSDVPATYTHQNTSYVTSISRSSSIYSKQNNTQEHLADKSIATTPEKKSIKEENEEDAQKEEETEAKGKGNEEDVTADQDEDINTLHGVDKDNKVAQIPANDLYKLTLQELKKINIVKEQNYQQKIKTLTDNLTNAKFLISKLSHTNNLKHKQHHENVHQRQQQLLKLSNSLSSLLLSAEPPQSAEISPSTSVLSFKSEINQSQQQHWREDSALSAMLSMSRFGASSDLSNISSSSSDFYNGLASNGNGNCRTGLKILTIVPSFEDEDGISEAEKKNAVHADVNVTVNKDAVSNKENSTVIA